MNSLFLSLRVLRLSFFSKLSIFGFLLLFLVVGCRKDSFSGAEQKDFKSLSDPKYPISVQEAILKFSELKSQSPIVGNSFAGGPTNVRPFVPMEPDWANLSADSSSSGREIIVVPLPDEELNRLNGGRAGAKLIFTKVGHDSIEVSILKYVADSAYFNSHNSQMNFNDYTGVYLFYDIGYNFRKGVYLRNGQPYSRVDSISTEYTIGGDDRTLDCHWELQLTVVDPCVAFWECGEVSYTWGYICDNWTPNGGGGGGGNGNSNGNGTPGGSGYGSGTGNGNGSGDPDPYGLGFSEEIWDILLGYVPLSVLSGPNAPALPSWLNADLIADFIWVKEHAGFTEQQLAALLNEANIDLLATIKNVLLGMQNNGEGGVNVTSILSFMAKNKMHSPNQFQYLADHPGVLEDLQEFQQDYAGLDYVHQTIQALVNAGTVNPNLPFGPAIFSPNGPAHGFPLSFTLAVNAEYGLLLIENANLPPAQQKSNEYLYTVAVWNVLASGIHHTLDALGLVPGLGEFADLTNGIIYSIEGDATNASLSFVSMIPVAGYYAAGTKYAIKITGASGAKVSLKYVVDNAGHIDFGDPGQLKTVIKPAAGYVAHHIIPVAVHNHDVVQLAGQKSWHMNDHLNGLGVTVFQNSDGGHAIYRQRIEQILEQIKTDNPGLTPDVAQIELTKLANRIRAIIIANPTKKMNELTIPWP